MPNRHAAPPAVKASSTVAPLRAAEPAFPEGSGVDRAGLILFTLAAMQFISTVDFMIVMPLGPLLFDTLGIDTVQFSWVVSAYTFAAGCAGFAAAAVLDRVGRRSAYIALSAGLLLGTLVCGLATNYHVLVAARCLTGAFGGVLGGLSYAIVADVFPEERRGRATGLLMSAFAVASVVGVPIGIALGTRSGWGVPFLVLAALGLPLLGMAAWMMPPLTGHLGGTRRRPLANLLDTLTYPSHRPALALTAILMFGAFSVIPYISASYVSNAGVTEAQLPVVFVARGLAHAREHAARGPAHRSLWCPARVSLRGVAGLRDDARGHSPAVRGACRGGPGGSADDGEQRGAVGVLRITDHGQH